METSKPVRFGKYLLLDRIARGGMAELFRAKITGDQGFQKLIAIKKIYDHLSSDEVLISCFIDEAKLAAFLQHKNIVQIYDFGSFEDSYFIAMEYLFGKDLKEVIAQSLKKQKPLSLENLLYIMANVCEGLDYAHNLKDFEGKPFKIIHRDINPHNIFITYDGQAKIIDFGIAHATSQSSLTQWGVIKGKVAYMSPEQANGGELDHRSDIFSTGIVLREMITGERMFQGDTMSVLALAKEGRCPPLSEQLKAKYPQELHSIMNRALAPKAEERYQSCAEMLSDLEKCAVNLKLHPSSRQMADTMASLFGQEIEEEERQMRVVAQIDIDGAHRQLPTGDLASRGRPGQQTVALNTGEGTGPKAALAQPRRKILIFGGLLVCLVTIALAFSFLHKPRPFKPGSYNSSLADRVGVEKTEEKVKSPVSVEPSSGTGLRAEKKETASPSAGPARVGQGREDDRDGPEAELIKEAEKAVAGKQFAKAISLYSQLLAANPAKTESLTPSYVAALLGRAAELPEGEQGKQEILLKKVVSLDPDNLEGNFQLALIFGNREQYSQAVATYQKLIRLDPDFIMAFFNLGYIYARTAEYDKAELMYEKVVESEPDFLDEALFNLAVIQNKLGKVQLSVKNLERAIAINPDNESARKFLKKIKGV
jgi:serine/threonine protein kinase/Tfp pilus assembly protein PilF